MTTPMPGDGVVTNNLVSWSQVYVFLVLFHFVDNVTDSMLASRADRKAKDNPVGDRGLRRNRTGMWFMARLSPRAAERCSGSCGQIG